MDDEERMMEGAADPYDLATYERRARKRSFRAVVAACAVVVALVAGLGGWQAWEALRPVEYSAYADEAVQVVGLGDSTLAVTPADLAELECSQVSASSSGRDTGQGAVERTAVGYGPTLDAFLEGRGFAVDDFQRIIVTCKDGYQTAITPDRLEGEVWLAFARGKDPLPEPMQPLRLIIPEMPAGQWAYGISTIEFIPAG